MEELTIKDVAIVFEPYGITMPALKKWVEGGWIQTKSHDRADGRGRRHYFDYGTLLDVALFKHLLLAGLTREEASGKIRETSFQEAQSKGFTCFNIEYLVPVPGWFGFGSKRFGWDPKPSERTEGVKLVSTVFLAGIKNELDLRLQKVRMPWSIKNEPE
jgi:hypothetical protein